MDETYTNFKKGNRYTNSAVDTPIFDNSEYDKFQRVWYFVTEERLNELGRDPQQWHDTYFVFKLCNYPWNTAKKNRHDEKNMHMDLDQRQRKHHSGKAIFIQKCLAMKEL